MWQKMDPRGFRVWLTQKRPSEWFGTSQTQASFFFVEDVKIRELVDSFYFRSAISKVVIRKTEKEGELMIFTAKPAVLLWKDGIKVEKFKKLLRKITQRTFKVVIKDIKKPELSAKIMAEFAAIQLENRMPYRRVAKSVLQKVMEKWAIWVKIQIWWRLGGAEMSRSEHFTDWRIPLQTIRADVDYHYTTAFTKYGILWIKVWICKSENVSISKKKVSLDKVVRN